MVGLKVIVAEFNNHSDALDAYLQLNGASVQHENSPSVVLIGMFDPDEESKNYVIEKKDQQKLEDEFDKLDKSVDKYLTIYLNQLISPDEYKERNLDKVSTQMKTDFFFKVFLENKHNTKQIEQAKSLQPIKDSIGYKITGTND